MKFVGVQLLFHTLLLYFLVPVSFSQTQTPPVPHHIGYALSISKITKEALDEAKAAGIDYIELSGMGGLIDSKTNQLNASSKEIKSRFNNVKAIADKAGIKIWSIHMPFGKEMDISLTNEVQRTKAVQNHQEILKHLGILQPQIILFHPSWYLGLNEREERKQKFIKSAITLQQDVEKINATMVVENMLGSKVLANKERERPLNRSVEEMVELMNRLPKNIYAAVDMNHIKNPELLIKAMGSRLKSVHIADGDGEREQHAFPCSGEGKNDWTRVIAALYKAGYDGVFMYECKFPSVQELKSCYETMYNNYITTLK
jgi:sugar phosphate isomerase/epimerase